MLGKSRLCLAIWILSLTVSFAADGLKKDGHLDLVAVRNAYRESEFDLVRQVLEGYLKKQSKIVTRDERTFAYKYLGVIYAADSLTQTRGASYFNMALELAPNLELLDMFAPKKIEDLFESVKSERQKKADYESHFDDLGNPIGKLPTDTVGPAPSVPGSGPKPKPAVGEKRDHDWIWWTLGTVAAVGTGTGVYLWNQSRSKKTIKKEVNGTE